MKDHVTREGLFEDEVVQDLAMYIEAGETRTYEEAADNSTWNKEMECEIQAIEKKQHWILTDLPTRIRVIGVKWIYKTKLNERGEIDEHKARLVALGYA